MGKILTLGCKVKPRGVPKNLPISETGRANILKKTFTLEYFNNNNLIFYDNIIQCDHSADNRLICYV